MPLRDRFRQFIADHELLAPGAPVVVGASGGMDSAVLLHLLWAEGFAVTAAHVNYALRGGASDADEQLVRDICAAIGVAFRSRRVTLGGSLQEAARDARYAFFAEVALSTGTERVATGHHRDDVAETVLLNLVRGTGPRGLAGIPVCGPLPQTPELHVVRPLLWARRSEIEQYARQHRLAWRDDASNSHAGYLRNVMRNTVLPILTEQVGADVSEQIAHTAELMRAYLDSGAALSAQGEFEVASDTSVGTALRLDVLQGLPEVARHGVFLEALRRWAPEAPQSTAAARELDALLEAQPGRRVEWEGITVWRNRRHLVFDQPQTPPVEEAEVQLGTTVTPLGTMRVSEVEGIQEAYSASPCEEVIDADRVHWPLRLRPWRAGDALRPLGLGGRKLVSDVLTERRVPPHRRSEQLVLVSNGDFGDGDIVWVVGHRLSESAAVEAGTRRAVRLEWNPEKRLDRGGGGR